MHLALPLARVLKDTLRFVPELGSQSGKLDGAIVAPRAGPAVSAAQA
jgi:hypothetical protein